MTILACRTRVKAVPAGYGDGVGTGHRSEGGRPGAPANEAQPIRRPTLRDVGRLAGMAIFALSCFGLLTFLWASFGGPIPLKPKRYQIYVNFPAATTLAEMMSALGDERARVLVIGLDASQAIGGELRAHRSHCCYGRHGPSPPARCSDDEQGPCHQCLQDSQSRNVAAQRRDAVAQRRRASCETDNQLRGTLVRIRPALTARPANGVRQLLARLPGEAGHESHRVLR